ncbi:hypothetical protein SDRG_09817 [Saprolegnia diclina VS20]|uniref:Uncharacterized protein n=1 Tax=Saprolegnia diclina (strain VS20) TaxID=1156394 RepID=T0QCT4_SAPDV|nr:hypothetical protein SDRG_09817 [Saprolegnia diclina VS20]EQC32491.1 hypothetical protein SDRG_09817 [Saprolegnia diclina VS20]|eukprot:XP_008613992.1 hypothetical protein SDRG_09817 [Saprolegnia diclina VS20]
MVKHATEKTGLMAAKKGVEIEMYSAGAGTRERRHDDDDDDAPVLFGYESLDKDMIPAQQEFLELSSMALQLSLRQMVRQVMTITDAAFQGHIGTKQLAGVTIASVYMGVPSTFIQNAIPAISTLCSQAYGAGNNTLVGIWLQTCIVFSVLGAIPIIIWYMFVGHMIALTLDDTEAVAYGQQFAMIMALGLIPQYLYGCLTTYFATQGVIMPATLCSTLTVFLNIGFNQLFIYGGFGYDGLGFIGSPIATVTSTCLQLLIFVGYTVWYKQYHLDYWGGWTMECISKERLLVFLPLAVPMGMSSVVDWASAACTTAFSGYLGPDIAACQAVLNGVFGVVNAFVSGFSTSTQIRMSRYLGQGSAVAAKRVLSIGASIVAVCGVTMVLLVYLLNESLFRVWSPDPVIISMCRSALVVFVCCIMVAFGRFMMTACLNALSMANINLIANNIGSWCLYVPLSYVLPITLHWGLDGFWYADMCGEAMKAVILTWGILRVDWSAAADFAQRAAEVTETRNPMQEETRELLAYENEALLTPTIFKSPGAQFGSVPHHTPSVLKRALSLTPKATRRPKDTNV